MYLSNTLSEIQGDSKKLFKFVSKNLDPQKNKVILPSTPSDPTELANKINSFFVDKVKNIRNSLPGSSTSTIPENVSQSFASDDVLPGYLSSFDPSTPAEIEKILKESGIRVSPSDVLPADLANDNKDILIPFLTWSIFPYPMAILMV